MHLSCSFQWTMRVLGFIEIVLISIMLAVSHPYCYKALFLIKG